MNVFARNFHSKFTKNPNIRRLTKCFNKNVKLFTNVNLFEPAIAEIYKSSSPNSKAGLRLKLNSRINS